jgi:hypothetical protein
VITRTLRRRISLQSEDDAVLDALQFLACDPDIAGASAIDSTIRVDRHGLTYRIFHGDDLLGEKFNVRGVVEMVQGHVFQLSIDDLPGAPVLHAACLRRGDRRLLLVGDKGTGKTTLTLRLLLHGYRIEGDENVFIRHGRVVARPRGLRVKEGSLRLVPELVDILPQLGYLTDHLDQRIYNLDPRLLGLDWRIEEGPADLIILLRANHGGYSSIRPVPTMWLVQEIMQEIGLREDARGAAIGAIVSLCSAAKGYDLSLGDHDQALRCIDRACDHQTS